MLTIGLIKEGKIPPDNRVALTPKQCKWVMTHFNHVKIQVQSCPNRCFSDEEFRRAGVEIKENLEACDILLGIKEVPVDQLIPEKTYLFFSHTKKKQPHNQLMLQTILKNKITLIDFECLEHEDGQRIIGFGFFAGVVGAHNGIMAYGHRTQSYQLGRVFQQKNFQSLIHTYFGLKIPNIKIAVTGSGRVAHGILEIMNLLGIIEVEGDEYKSREFSYPVYVQLKGADLYRHKKDGTYNREHFHLFPEEYECRFTDYTKATQILMNGVYWEQKIPRLFQPEDVASPHFRLQTIADVTDDAFGSVPINLGDQSIEQPVYGVDRNTLTKTEPYLPNSVDIMAVGNLPNELPRDASRYFGEQLIKYVLPDLLSGGSTVIDGATITKDGKLTYYFGYLQDYAEGQL